MGEAKSRGSHFRQDANRLKWVIAEREDNGIKVWAAGIEAAVEKALPGKKSAKGLRQGQMVESFLLLSALGGDCIEDIERKG